MFTLRHQLLVTGVRPLPQPTTTKEHHSLVHFFTSCDSIIGKKGDVVHGAKRMTSDLQLTQGGCLLTTAIQLRFDSRTASNDVEW